MPAEVVVVKRSRRRAFAVLRATPAWLRSLWIAAWRSRRRPESDASLAPASTAVRPVALMRLALRPQLVRVGDGGHRCVGCDLCVRICPSRCLSLATQEGEVGAPGRVLRFELDGPRCIGCDRCAEACPEDALEMAGAAAAALAPRSSRQAKTDLLALAGAGVAR